MEDEADDGIDLMGDNMEEYVYLSSLFYKLFMNLKNNFFSLSSDYCAIPRLDVYDPTTLDDEEYDQMNIGARQEAEKVMGRRDREEALTSGRLRRGLLYGTIQFVNLFFGKMADSHSTLSQYCLANLTIFPVGEKC